MEERRSIKRPLNVNDNVQNIQLNQYNTQNIQNNVYVQLNSTAPAQMPSCNNLFAGSSPSTTKTPTPKIRLPQEQFVVSHNHQYDSLGGTTYVKKPGQPDEKLEKMSELIGKHKITTPHLFNTSADSVGVSGGSSEGTENAVKSEHDKTGSRHGPAATTEIASRNIGPFKFEMLVEDDSENDDENRESTRLSEADGGPTRARHFATALESHEENDEDERENNEDQESGVRDSSEVFEFRSGVMTRRASQHRDTMDLRDLGEVLDDSEIVTAPRRPRRSSRLLSSSESESNSGGEDQHESSDVAVNSRKVNRILGDAFRFPVIKLQRVQLNSSTSDESTHNKTLKALREQAESADFDKASDFVGRKLKEIETSRQKAKLVLCELETQEACLRQYSATIDKLTSRLEHVKVQTALPKKQHDLSRDTFELMEFLELNCPGFEPE